ncbi:hypothetical protein IMX26_02475 [Clostridium sp. 'deep sea']|uniref:hypothetical protein n=1 Tax=Clostridium sp. 'deep sea' TaxID=2779445 RepID=UPI0018964E3C|nr:hypothetical protein [Clostridium sp. 'deep sea']QOR35718.1 hypothetical protein IMX26_02475 [Clostridium sp. 'deep sea']
MSRYCYFLPRRRRKRRRRRRYAYCVSKGRVYKHIGKYYFTMYSKCYRKTVQKTRPYYLGDPEAPITDPLIIDDSQIPITTE